MWLAGLLLVFSAAPCTAPAYAAPAQPVISKPYDPCLGAATTMGTAACVQLACQILAEPVPLLSDTCPLTVSPVEFQAAVTVSVGRRDAPADPPPRSPMN